MTYSTDPSQNYLERIPQPLDALFFPTTIALIGAKSDPGSVAATLYHNLSQGKAPLYLVNPKRKEVFGKTVYPAISHVPAPIDLAVIATPAATIPSLILECIEAGVKSAIVISAGFKEMGDAGISLEREIAAHLKHSSMPVIGPNCLGVMNPLSSLNATFAKGSAKPGHVAFLSQSGALCTAVLDWSFEVNIGFSAFVSVGSMIDVSWGDLISYFGSDPNTHSILLYMETVGDAGSFLSAAREVALQKPLVVIKPGRTGAAAKAAASHTGSLVGDDAVFDAALERVGVLRVDTISELFDMAETLAKQPLPQGPNLAIITNAGGPAVIATDAAIRHGAKIPPLEEKTKETLSRFLPPAWSRSNPIDILGDAASEAYEKTIHAVMESPEFDGILTILTPQDMTEPLKSAQGLLKNNFQKPLLASWMGAETVKESNEALNKGGICTYAFPDQAAKAFAMMWKQHQNLRDLYEFSSTAEKITPSSFEEQQKRIEKAKRFLSGKKRILTEGESKSLLALYDIPVVETLKAGSSEEAVEKARRIGFPVVLKLLSSTITHKSDVGGVLLNLKSEEEVLLAFDKIKASVDASDFDGVSVQKMIATKGIELILGSSIDPQFGPVLLFGAGGEMVEVFQDTHLALPPLNNSHAHRLIKKTKISRAFQEFRGREALDERLIIHTLLKFSQMIAENPWIAECDINPLLASVDGVLALDARVVADPGATRGPVLRSYPYQYCKEETLKDGRAVLIRPIKADDVALLKKFHEELSEHTVHQRYLQFLSLSDRVKNERLHRICLTDYTNEFVLVATAATSSSSDNIVGIVRLSRLPSTKAAQLFMVIHDGYQRCGLGSCLLQNIIAVAKQEGLEKIVAKILSENTGMIALCRNHGFQGEQEGEFVIMSMLT